MKCLDPCSVRKKEESGSTHSRIYRRRDECLGFDQDDSPSSMLSLQLDFGSLESLLC